jgi:glycolate oxidase
VLVDGGILRGTDVIKAIALGARAVGVGKLLGWALAAGGQAGIERMLELLDIEIKTAMGLMGVTKLSQLNPSWVRPAMLAAPLSSTSAYPWYEERIRR